MTGTVNANLEAIVQLSIRGEDSAETAVDCVIDTGFSGFLTLPPAIIESLGLPWIASEEGVLADGSVILFDVYRATVMWEARERAVEIQGAETSALLGMAMLENHDVSMRVRPGGQVRIQLDLF
jgi:clan AA aspartic protease